MHDRSPLDNRHDYRAGADLETPDSGSKAWEITATIVVAGMMAVACAVGLLALITL